jgi:hypothetical protein
MNYSFYCSTLTWKLNDLSKFIIMILALNDSQMKVEVIANYMTSTETF